MKYFFLFLYFVIFLPLKATAYPSFIGHGYNSCITCHYNPLGNGPLTDYGRAVGATGIASGIFYPKSWSEEKIASFSGLFFKKPSQDHFRGQVNYRGLKLIQNPGTSFEREQWINMQVDAQLIAKFGEEDRLIGVLNFGYTPKLDRPVPGVDQNDPWRSREHYIGYRLTPKWRIYGGLMDKAYGIRVAEHIAYSRTTPYVTQNDQAHGILAHYLNEDWEISTNFFLGNLFQEKDLQFKGASALVERNISDIHRVGFSLMKSSNQYLDLTSYALHSRLSFKEGSALLFEVGQTQRKTKNRADDRTARYGLLQTYVRPTRGLYALANIEYLCSDTKLDSYSIRWGPGFQFFPVQRVELRADAYNTRNFNPKSSTRDTWMVLFQTHLWL